MLSKYGNNVKSKNMIGDNVRKFRKKKGLTQDGLARKADISNNTIINIEAGKQQNPTVETFKKIAKALDVPIEDLIK